MNTVKCDAADGSGCGEVWLEYNGIAREHCPKCGKQAVSGHVIVNSEDTTCVKPLDNPNVFVPIRERREG